MSLSHTVEELEVRYAGGAASPGFPRIAEAMLREGRIEEAIQLASDGIHRFPTLLTGFLVLARGQQQAGRLDEARSQFESALRLDPRCPSARHGLAQIAEQLQWKSVALEHWRMLCELEPWDEKAREAYGRMLREAPGGTPAPKLPTSYAPQDAIPASSGVSEYRLDDVADFLPKEDQSDLAAALPASESDWSMPAMAAATLETPPSKPVEAEKPAIAFPEPSPLDLLREDNTPAADKPNALDEGAPFSGEDVADRLNDLFGLGADAPQASETQFQNQSPSFFEEAPTGEATAYSQAAETGFLEGQTPVDGDDVVQRLDHLFESKETQASPAQPKPEANPFEADSAFEDPSSAETLGEALGEDPGFSQTESALAWTPVATPARENLPDREVAESEARAAGESTILPIEEVQGEGQEPEVTGEDIADRLDALFEESATASSMILRPEAKPADSERALPDGSDIEAALSNLEAPGAHPEDPGTHSHSVADLMGDHTLVMPSMRAEDLQVLEAQSKPDLSTPGDMRLAKPMEDDSLEGRETMILSVDSMLGVKPFEAETPAVSFPNLESTPSFTAPEKGAFDMSETVDMKPAPEAVLFATDETLTAESLGLPDVAGDDVGQRLDDIFGSDPETAVTDKLSDDASSLLNIEEMEPLETALAPSPDTAYVPRVEGEPVVSGDDISSRLAELFGETDETEAVGRNAHVTLEQDLRGTHLDAVDMPTMAMRAMNANTDSLPAQEQPAASPEAIGDPNMTDAFTTVAMPNNALADEEMATEEEEVFEPGTTSIATVTLAEIYFNQGLKEQALQIYRQLLEREPDNESVHKRIQEIEASKADGDDKGSGPDDSRPRPGLKIPRRKK